MEVYSGIGANGGIAIGKLQVLRRNTKTIECRQIEDVNTELIRFEEAKQKAVKLLQDLYEKAVREIGEADALIFEVHQMILEDIVFISTVKKTIQSQLVNAEYAVAQTATEISGMFSSMDDELMKERAADIKDASRKVLTFLSGEDPDVIKVDQPAILLADDLVPSETVQLDRTMVLGFITQKGSKNSHTAILARNMDIPAVVGADILLKSEYDQVPVILDGYEGKLYLNPDQEVLAEFREKLDQQIQKKVLLQQLKGKESITADGKKINIYANIGTPEDVVDALHNDAEGIGLFRSEFLYLGQKDYPTEEEQFLAYRTVVEAMKGKRVIIRTLDIGADKKVDYFGLEEEENPALGYRAIRICLDREELFKTQLRAIYRSSAYGTVAIMFPMIISLEEVLKIKEILKEVKDELVTKGISFAEIEIGIMIETPSAAILSDILAKEVDFFSIGTNDLTQYTCAIDRQNPKLDKIYNPHHPAVLRLIDMVVRNAHDNGIWVGICGELASDLALTGAFLTLGIDELSVSPGKILELRKEVINYKD